jgi:hypothetical protein
MNKGELAMPNYDDLIEALRVSVENATTVTDSAVAYITGVPALIQAAIDEAVAAGATPEQTAAFDDLKMRLDAEIGDLQAALVANTPEQPEPPVTP